MKKENTENKTRDESNPKGPYPENNKTHLMENIVELEKMTLLLKNDMENLQKIIADALGEIYDPDEELPDFLV